MKPLFMRKVLVVALSLSMFCTACSTAWVSTLDSILAAAAPALINILQIVAVANGQPVNATLAAKINADATIIKTLAVTSPRPHRDPQRAFASSCKRLWVYIRPISNLCFRSHRWVIQTRRRKLRYLLTWWQARRMQSWQ
jgi:hypothetical protein